jgi:hypothetical protein
MTNEQLRDMIALVYKLAMGDDEGDNEMSDARTLLSEGLDLCVRARNMDSIDRTNATLSTSKDPEGWQKSGMFAEHVRRHNIYNPDAPLMTRSGTVYLWMQQQYDKDLADWERRARDYLTKNMGPEP